MKRQKIPVSLEILADMETPLSVYNKLANEPYSYLFESVNNIISPAIALPPPAVSTDSV